MAHFPDLSFYDYSRGNPPQTKNVGWLRRGHAFETATPLQETLDRLWNFCKIAVAQTRGYHPCDLCAPPAIPSCVRDGVRLLLGSAEIRVFSKDVFSPLRQRLRDERHDGLLILRKSSIRFGIYAAPNLIYHYVEAHHYKPPDEFLDALHNGPPVDEKYFQCLKHLELEWRLTSAQSLTEQ